MWILITAWLTVAGTLLDTKSLALKIQQNCIDKSDLQKTAKLNCGDQGQIVDVIVSLGNGTCNAEALQCSGQTLSFLVDHFNCYWKNNCTINWPRDTFITPGTSCSLVGSHPEFMRIRYTCLENIEVEKNVIWDICLPQCLEKTFVAQKGMAGIIRSHELYPWDYPTEVTKCTLIVYFPLESTTKNQKLVVSIQDIELSEGDTLTVKAVLRNESIPGKMEEIKAGTMVPGKNIVFENNMSKYINFALNIGEESKGGRGFVLCFKFVNINERLNKSDICSDITRQGDIEKVAETAGSASPLVLSQVGEVQYATSVDSVFTAPGLTQAPLVTATELPTKCKKKKSDKARRRCSNRTARRRGGRKKGKKGTNGQRKKKRNKDPRKKRNHKETRNE